MILHHYFYINIRKQRCSFLKHGSKGKVALYKAIVREDIEVEGRKKLLPGAVIKVMGVSEVTYGSYVSGFRTFAAKYPSTFMLHTLTLPKAGLTVNHLHVS